jgi:hypothetical protein
MNDNWQDPKSMAPRSSALWEWYKTLSQRLNNACQIPDEGRAYMVIGDIADEIDEHAAEMEYQCRI